MSTFCLSLLATTRCSRPSGNARCRCCSLRTALSSQQQQQQQQQLPAAAARRRRSSAAAAAAGGSPSSSGSNNSGAAAEDDDDEEEGGGLLPEEDVEISGSYRAALSSNTPLGQAVSGACDELDALGALERQALEQAEDLLKQLGVKRSIFAAPAPKSEEE